MGPFIRDFSAIFPTASGARFADAEPPKLWKIYFFLFPVQAVVATPLIQNREAFLGAIAWD